MKKYQEEFRIRYSDCDRFGKLKLRAVFDYAQEIAGNHATLLGCGDQLREHRSLAWILSRMRVRMLEWPKSETQVHVETWPSGFNRLFATREFRFRTGKEQRVFAEGTSYWLLFNLETQRLAITQKEMEGLNLDTDDAERIFLNLDKLKGEEAAPVVTEFQVYEHQIDINRHLNNAEYAAFLQDALGYGCYPSELQINFQKEVPPQSKISICGHKDAESFSFSGFVGEEEVFLAEGTLFRPSC